MKEDPRMEKPEFLLRTVLLKMYTIWTAEQPYINHVSHRFMQRKDDDLY